MYRRLIALGLGIGAVITAIPAHAQDNCAQRDQVVLRLQEDFAEQLTAGGLYNDTENTSVVEVWSSPETGTFTVMLTTPDGFSCIVATGTDWHAQEVETKFRGTMG